MDQKQKKRSTYIAMGFGMYWTVFGLFGSITFGTLLIDVFLLSASTTAYLLILLFLYFGMPVVSTLLGLRFITKRWPDITWSSKHSLRITLIVLPIIIAMLPFLFVTSSPEGLTRAPDSQRLSDLSAVKSSLGLYRAETGNPYPSASGSTPEERWQEVEDVILSMESPPISAIPWDPKNKGELYYDYGVSPEGDQFVLRAKFSSERYSVGGLNKTGIDGERFGIDCGDPEHDTVYCIGVILDE